MTRSAEEPASMLAVVAREPYDYRLEERKAMIGPERTVDLEKSIRGSDVVRARKR
jgi:hypothetical protein